MANPDAKEIVSKKDFIELEFLGRNLTNNEVFDSNILEEAKKLNPKVSGVKPLVICVGYDMVVKGLDEFLIGKEMKKKYTLNLTPERAFGKRDSKLIRLIPLKMFLEQKVYPEPGMTLALDNNLVKVVSVSGGRVMVDFNNPLAGKDIEYEFTIKKKVEDIKTKAESLQNFLFGQVFEFDADEKAKKLIFKDVKLTPILNVFKDKFKEILGYDIEIFEKKEEKKEENKDKKEATEKKEENNQEN
jgi:FKBP-type peptidyl-prolyl cis-trans isomerase SlyD